MSKNGNLTIVLQAGGESRRMGRSKATVPFLGEPLLWRGINRLMPLADEFLITTNEPQNLSFLDDLIDLGKVRLVTDDYEQRGALRGVYTAINAASLEFVALVACDMIFPSRNLIAAELEAVISNGADIAVPEGGATYVSAVNGMAAGEYRISPADEGSLPENARRIK